MFLLWETKRGTLKTADPLVTGFPTKSESSVVNYVIDGGHRLVTLYNCFHKTTITNRPFFEIVFDLDEKTFEARGKVKAKSNGNFIPLSVALSPEAVIKLKENDEIPEEVMDSRRRTLVKLQAQFQNYKLAIMTLSEANLNDVILSFETLNTRGVKLTKAEIEKADAMRSAEAFKLVFEQDPAQKGFIADFLPLNRDQWFDDGRPQPIGPHPTARVEVVGKNFKVDWLTLPTVFEDLRADLEKRIKKEYQPKIQKKSQS
jgi:hypothetical protein